MATVNVTPESSVNNQPIGTTLVVLGPVQAQSANYGTVCSKPAARYF